MLPAALLALAACGTTTRFAPLNAAPHPLRPRPAASVEIFTTATPSRPYTEIGLIQGTQESEYSFDEMPQIIAAMRAEAGRIGCDGLVLNGPNSRSVTSTTGALAGQMHERTLEGFWGTCIAFLDQGAPEQGAFEGAVVVAPPPPPAPVVVPPPPPRVAPPPPPRVAPPPPPAAPVVAPPPPPAPVVVPPPPPRVAPPPPPAAPVVAPPPPPRVAEPAPAAPVVAPPPPAAPAVAPAPAPRTAPASSPRVAPAPAPRTATP